MNLKFLDNRKVMAFILVVSALGMALGTSRAYAALRVTGNTVTETPQSPPALALVSSNTTPYVGDTVTFTATISNLKSGASLAGITVTFRLGNGSVLGTAPTSSGGVATFSYVIPNLTVFTVTPTADVS